MVLLVPSDADGDDGGDDDGVPTTLPAWQGPRGYHGQGSNIPFGESLTLIYIYIYIYIYMYIMPTAPALNGDTNNKTT